MFASGIGLILRGVAIGFFHPSLYVVTLPYLGIGVYSISRGMARERRTIIRVAVVQFVGTFFCDLAVHFTGFHVVISSSINRQERRADASDSGPALTGFSGQSDSAVGSESKPEWISQKETLDLIHIRRVMDAQREMPS